MDDASIADNVKVLKARQRKIMNHLSRQDEIVAELQQAISCASNNSNCGVRYVPISQTIPGTGNIASRKEFRSNNNQACSAGSKSGNKNNANDSFKDELMRCMRKINSRMNQNAKEFHVQIDHILGAPPVLKGPDSKKYSAMFRLLYNICMYILIIRLTKKKRITFALNYA